MIHVGVDLHQRFCYMTVLEARGKIIQSGPVTNEKLTLRRYFRQFRGKEVQVAVEACGFWPAFREVVEPEVKRLVLVHPQRVKAIASAKLKNDRVDSETLAHLLRCDLLPESWKADRETQARRQQVRLRATLVRHRTRLKNQVHAVLHQQGLHAPVSDLFGKRGRLWLAQVELPTQARESVKVCLRLLDGYSEEIQKQNLQLSETAKQDKRAEWLMTIPGIGECSAMMLLAEIGEIGRFRHPEGLCSYAGLVPRVRESAQGGARRHHAARLALAALDHGGSGPGGDPQFAGRPALLRTLAAQEAQARGAGRAGPQVADRGLRPAARRRGV